MGVCFSKRVDRETSVRNSNDDCRLVDLPGDLLVEVMKFSDVKTVISLHDASQDMRAISDFLTEFDLNNINKHPSSIQHRVKLFRDDVGLLHSISTNARACFGMAKDNETPPYVLEYLILHENSWHVRCAAASHRSTPIASLCNALDNDIRMEVRMAAAANPSVPLSVLQDKLWNHTHWKIRRAITTNRALPVNDLIQVLLTDEVRLRRAAASNEMIPPDILDNVFRTDNDWFVRHVIAANPSTPSVTLDYILTVLNDDQNSRPIRTIAAANQLASSSALDYVLRFDPSNLVRFEAAANPSAPSDALDYVVKNDVDIAVRSSAALNQSSEPNTLSYVLYTEPVESVRRMAATNPRTPGSALVYALENDVHQVRIAAGGNPSTPTELLLDILNRPLLHDSDWLIRRAVLNNRALSPYL